MARKRKRTKRRKCSILAIIQKNDPTRLRERTVHTEKGKGRKSRPRDNQACIDEFFDSVVQAV